MLSSELRNPLQPSGSPYTKCWNITPRSLAACARKGLLHHKVSTAVAILGVRGVIQTRSCPGCSRVVYSSFDFAYQRRPGHGPANRVIADVAGPLSVENRGALDSMFENTANFWNIDTLAWTPSIGEPR